jgi:hypothetical protein
MTEKNKYDGFTEVRKSDYLIPGWEVIELILESEMQRESLRQQRDEILKKSIVLEKDVEKAMTQLTNANARIAELEKQITMQKDK